MAKKKKEKSFSSFLNNPFDFTLVITILLLLGIGLVMVLSASSPSALSESGNSYAYFSKQLLFAVLGIIAMSFISKIDYRFYQKFYKHAWWISIILLALVMSPLGKEVNGAKRWIYLTETLSFQPSEIVKFLMIIFYALIIFVPGTGVLKSLSAINVANVVITMLYYAIVVNVGLGVFNLIPIPPLDGSKIFLRFLPYRAQRWIDENMQMISIIFLFLFVTNILGYITTPVITVIMNGIEFVVRAIFSIFI